MADNEYMRAWQFSMTLPELSKFWESHAWKCDICNKSWDTRQHGGGLVIDHDHKCCKSKDKKSCGKCIRGTLCGSCNVGLGRAQDSISILMAAKTYLSIGHIDFSNFTLRKRKNQMGDSHPGAKHSNEKIKELRRRLQAKEYTTKVALAEEFDINPESIYNYLKPRQAENYASPYSLKEFQENNVKLNSLASRAHRSGINQFQLEALYVMQMFKCAICQISSKQEKLVIDHDHKCCESQAVALKGKKASKLCGKCIRGLLCYNCNGLISCFKESEQLLDSAYNYVK